MFESDIKQNPITISELNRLSKHVLEQALPMVLVEGEISNFAMPRSGHWYFSLKDDTAQVRCAMFRGRNSRAGFMPKDGMLVQAKASVTLYENRGDFQLIIDEITEQGDGALRRQFDQLKNQLHKEGLFDDSHKKPLPDFIHTLGVITSSTGAALQDILTTLKRRYPLMHVLVYPSEVQGRTAANTLIQAIEKANQDSRADVLLLARGGGSLEDLWPFNEERLARAIFKSALPIVTGIGHEVDFTIADFVADERGATPTAAAELVSPDQNTLRQSLASSKERLQTLIQNLIAQYNTTLRFASKHLLSLHPKRSIHSHLQQLDFLQQRLCQLMQHTLSQYKHQLSSIARSLDALSPLKTLARGYTITFREGKSVTKATELKVGDKLITKLAEGDIESTVEKVST